MCGFVGFRRKSNADVSRYRDKIISGSEGIKHRGPDGHGCYEDLDVILSHRRLSIFDTSSNGSQPMVSKDARNVIVLNGEIYNFKELKFRFLTDLELRSQSDTEVLLECFAKIGVNETLSNVRGMYSFCFHDKQEGITYLGRDPFGEKPLYYVVQDDGLFFASDINGLLPFLKSRELDYSVLKAYLRFGYCPGENSIFKNVKKLDPGSVLVFDGHSVVVNRLCKLEEFMVVSNESYDFKYERFKSALEKAIFERSAADVPVGVLLSGGVDSSVVASVLASRGSIETFNLAFNEKDYDESEIASNVSRYLGTRHSTMLFSSQDALALIPTIPDVFSEPFADISLLPTLAISKFAREKVTVALSGDGGDELLFGYNKYFQMDKIRKYRALSCGVFEKVELDWLKHFFGERKSDFIKEVFRSDVNLDLVFSSYNRDLEGLLLDHSDEVVSIYEKKYENEFHVLNRMKDIYQYLPDNILVKSDRCSMYNSLEMRAPFLDLELLEASFAFTFKELYGMGVGKRPLRKLLSEYVPSEVYNVKRKRGFSIPIEQWLRKELKPLIDYQLSDTKISADGVFNPVKVRYFYDLFYKGHQNYAQLLWSILIFNLWHDKYVNR